MAKATTIKIKLVSTADTGYFYVTKKNSRTMTEKLTMKKYDPWPRSTSTSRKPRSSDRLTAGSAARGRPAEGRPFCWMGSASSFGGAGRLARNGNGRRLFRGTGRSSRPKKVRPVDDGS